MKTSAKAKKPKDEELEQYRAMSGKNDLVFRNAEGAIEVIIDGKISDPREEIETDEHPAVRPQPGFKDATDKYVDRLATGFLLGTTRIQGNEQVRERLEERVTKRVGAKGKMLTDRLFELIEGVYVIDKVGGKDVRYYKVPPNLQAITYALDRVLGKPVQHVKKDETKKGILVVENIIKNLAAPRDVPVKEPRRNVGYATEEG